MVFAEDNKTVDIMQSKKGEPKGLYEHNIESTLLYESVLAEPSVVLRVDLNQVYGVRIYENYPSFHFINKDSPKNQLHKKLVNSFNGEHNR